MCGITGLIDLQQTTDRAELTARVVTMTNALAHRGPDGDGVWVDPRCGIALGHRRLAILDLSPAGHQPMISRNQRFIISYNGEVYNALELRTELSAKGYLFKGHSDTEVIVEGCSAWGVNGCVERLNGMFAFALWDREQRTLYLVRDRVGIKPLYWARIGELFIFGSELKALRAHPLSPTEIDRDALSGYMRHGYIAAPRSIYRGVQKLEPGHILVLDAGGQTTFQRYWNVREIATTKRAASSVTDVGDQLEALLKDAVHRCMITDVPIGAFLSGGIDSATVVSLMQSVSSQPVRTFTIGFEDAQYNEATYAKAVAAHLGTDHTELYVNDCHLLEVVPKLSKCFDEPFADPSQIPTYLLAALTRQKVTVALSGDGGDELFGGYTRYFQAQQLWKTLGRLPTKARQHLAYVVDQLASSCCSSSAGHVPAWLQSPRTCDKMHKLADFLMDGGSTALYRQLMSHWPRPGDLVLHAIEPRGPLWGDTIADELPQLLDQTRLIDFLTYLPDHVLAKVDRATMAVGLEARVPLLDHRVVALAWSMPAAMLVQGNVGKWPLRRLLHHYVPRHLIDRPKAGFIPPIGQWLRGPLKDWAEALLDERRLREQALLNPAPIKARWQSHLNSGNDCEDRSSPLWNVLVFQAWLERQEPTSNVPSQQRVETSS